VYTCRSSPSALGSSKGLFPSAEVCFVDKPVLSYVEFNINFIGAHYQYLTLVSRLQDMSPINIGLSPQFYSMIRIVTVGGI
jgi:hypothetical protein